MRFVRLSVGIGTHLFQPVGQVEVGGSQFIRVGSKAGRARPVSIRCARIWRISIGFWMTADNCSSATQNCRGFAVAKLHFISLPHLGHTNGSISYTFARSRAHARLPAFAVTSSPSLRGSKPGSCAAEASLRCDSRHPSGARAATWGRHLVPGGRELSASARIAAYRRGRWLRSIFPSCFWADLRISTEWLRCRLPVLSL